ncbi:hypothetical protein O181_040799 [Austropuccinia psidii MF-1]|uniref:Uncharacterized protein n=1 Tax=Austropuccinia psidii MF-1 TaxID=1389203 RepID=A0A9Q3HFW7_9BASI|nr:hypothetical protein [Austropuccinia psidii MF-1]
MPLKPPSHWPNPQHRLPSLNSCSALNMKLRCRPHHSSRFRTHTFFYPHKILMLLRRPHDIPPMPPSTPFTPVECPPDMPPTLPSHWPNPQCRLPS